MPNESYLEEDELKKILKEYLERDNWTVTVAWGKKRGIDIDAKKGKHRWIIEAKGCGSLSPMRVNYFISGLGELLQHMDDYDAKYSLAVPDIEQFKKLWEKLPDLAKERIKISCLFVDTNGNILEK